MKNAYRVLLTRARQGLEIYVPTGNDMDYSTQKKYYDELYRYFQKVGIDEI